MMGPIQRVNVDLASGMLEELDRAAKELNISRQAVIKTLIRQALISNIWYEGALPLLSGGRIRLPVGLAYSDCQWLAGPRGHLQVAIRLLLGQRYWARSTRTRSRPSGTDGIISTLAAKGGELLGLTWFRNLALPAIAPQYLFLESSV
jgi:hypothetical protein